MKFVGISLVAVAGVVSATLLSVFSLSSCSSDNGECFEVSGNISGLTNDTTLVFEAITIEGDVVLDSVRLTPQRASFAFRAARPASPEFYRLRMGDELLNLCIDSTEHVCVEAQAGRLSTDYTVAGSEKCEQMRLMSVRQQRFRADVTAVMERDGMSPSQRQDAVRVLVDEFKADLQRDFIAPDYSSAVAYCALFQTFGGSMVFDPMGNRRDARQIAAVATAWDMLYPDAPRTKNLKQVALQGLAATAPPRTLEITSDKIHETGIIDISLPDVHGRQRTLSDLEGRVVLLDFTAYAMPDAAQRQLFLRELYNRYAEQGLEIYQVGLDPDPHFWSTRADQLPWTCVYCEEGLNADILRLYNVQTLPSYYLIDRTSTLHARGDMIDDIDSEIRKLL